MGIRNNRLYKEDTRNELTPEFTDDSLYDESLGGRPPVGGGGGGGSIPGSDTLIPINTTPTGELNDDYQITVSVNANEKSSILVDGVLTYRETPNLLLFKISEIVGTNKTITISKNKYKTDERYIIDVVLNPFFSEAQLEAIKQNYGYKLEDLFNNIVNSPTEKYYSSTKLFVPRVRKFIGSTQVEFPNLIDNTAISLTFDIKPQTEVLPDDGTKMYYQYLIVRSGIPAKYEDSILTYRDVKGQVQQIQTDKYGPVTNVCAEENSWGGNGQALYTKTQITICIPSGGDTGGGGGDTGGGGGDTGGGGGGDVVTIATGPKINLIFEGPANAVEGIFSEAVISTKRLSDADRRVLLSTNVKEIVFPEIAKTLQIKSTNPSNYRIRQIVVKGEGLNEEILTATQAFETISTIIQGDRNYRVSIFAEEIFIPRVEVPTISFYNNDVKTINKNSITSGDATFPIGINISENTSKIKYFIGGKSYEKVVDVFASPFLVQIPVNIFENLGTYKIIFVGNNQSGDSDSIETNINVVNEIYVGTPDVRNIVYPKNIKGADYKGLDVDFEIRYDVIDTTIVRIYKDGSDKFIESSPTALTGNKQSFNFKRLYELAGNNVENGNTISITLNLIPYNLSGKDPVIGKKESVTISFNKSDLEIPREVAISRLAEAFVNQFNLKDVKDETSKHLTHFLHLGDADNKLISNWVGDRGSLILKLYEPLPTSVQPNQQVFISKIQSNPIVETITITGIDEDLCPPLKGPNFSLNPDNGIGYRYFEELTASGSLTSNDIVVKYLNTNGIDTSKLNIQYVSSSFYTFDNFIHYGSAEEKANNFFYKMQLLEDYTNRYERLIQPTYSPPPGPILTEDGYKVITEDGLFNIIYETFVYRNVNEGNEAKRLLTAINELIAGLDGFEKWLYSSTNNLAYPKSQTTTIFGNIIYVLKDTNDAIVTAWYEALIAEAAEYDKYNANYLVNNIPEFITRDSDNSEFILFLDMIGSHFDILWTYINGIKRVKNVNENSELGVSDSLVWYLLESLGWKGKRAYDSQFLWEYAFGTYQDGSPKYSMSLEEANNKIWRRILNNLPYLLKHKGTSRALKAVMACYGVPQSMLTIMEFGGPQNPSENGSTKFTFDDRTAAINLQPSSSIIIPWHETNGAYPQAIEFRIKPDVVKTTHIVSSSAFDLYLYQTTGSKARLEFNLGSGQTQPYFETSGVGAPYITSSIVYVEGPSQFTESLDFPFTTDEYSQILINKNDYGPSYSLYEVLLASTNGERITTYVSMSILTSPTDWTGSQLSIGNDFDGTLDEVRLWRVPLQPSKFQNHALHPDAINGNSYTASTADLLFRLDFEYPKDRTKTENLGILNVAINETYGEPFASASNMYSASSYPYQYIPYDRTVTATVPSMGLNYSNKIRFEEQTLVTDLSYKARATKKSFDRAPIDSSRLGLFFSPIKELNMDILKAFGDFNIDNYIGDPSDEYKDNYSELKDLREYYFDRLNRNIYEYINLVKYIDKSLFDALAELTPARAKVSKGLLIEPHYLERNKIKHTKPVAESFYEESNIDTRDNIDIISSYNVKDTILNVLEDTELQSSRNDYQTQLNVINFDLEGNDASYQTVIHPIENELEASAPFYEASIQVPTGSSLTGEADSFTFEAIGMEKNSLSNLGFGLYGKQGVGIFKYYDIFGNYTSSRQNIYAVTERRYKKVSTQVSGYPTGSGAVRYENKLVAQYDTKVSLLPFSGSITYGSNTVEVVALDGYFPTHYKFVNNLSEGMKRSFFKGSLQDSTTTPDGLDPVETFITNPNILRVAKTGRGSGEPILEVD